MSEATKTSKKNRLNKDEVWSVYSVFDWWNYDELDFLKAVKKSKKAGFKPEHTEKEIRNAARIMFRVAGPLIDHLEKQGYQMPPIFLDEHETPSPEKEAD